MHGTPRPTATRGIRRSAAWWLAATLLPLLGTGCATVGSAGKARFGCYDARGRLEPTIVTKSECEVRDWDWREIR